MNAFKQHAAQKLYSFAMNCGQSLRFLFVLAILTLATQQDISAQTMSMYDVPVGSNFKPKREIVIHKRVNFVFEKTVRSIRPEAGVGFTDINSNTFTVVYSTGGEKNITVTTEPLGSTEEFKITVKEPKQGVTYKSPDDIWEISNPGTYTPTSCEVAAYPIASERPVAGTASCYIKYGAGHNNKLVRPLIFIDGIDFSNEKFTDPDKGNKIIRHGSTGWDALTMGRDDGELDEPENGVPDTELFEYYPTAFDALTASSAANGNGSYDIIFVDFSNGTDYIQRNSLLLMEVIRRVNVAKVADLNGTTHKNVVIGASMGGQVARIALAQMEQRGENHCTHTYVSFDSPHKGANIPLSLQAMSWFLSQSQLSYFSYSLKDFWGKLKQPAARQLLIQHFGAEVQKGNLSLLKPQWATPQFFNIQGDFICLREEYLADLNRIGYPKNTRNIAISDGSTLCSSINQGYVGGAELLDANIQVAGNIIGQIQLYAGASFLNYQTSNYIRSYCPLSNSIEPYVFRNISYSQHQNVIFASALPAGGLALACGYEAVVVRANTDLLQLDHVAGCVRKDLPTVKKLLIGYGASIDQTYQRRTSFMPTMSTLDLNWDLTNANMSRNIDRNTILRDGLSPFENFYAPGTEQGDNTQNLKHVELTARLVTWLQDELKIGSTRGGSINQLPFNGVTNYDYDKDGLINNKLAVNNNGILSVNATGAKPSVTVTVSGSCSSARVDVHNGGRFNIGTATAQGIVKVVTGGVVAVNNGGLINLSGEGQLIIENGGKLIIEAGANLNLVGTESKIIIQNGGELIINGQPIFTGSGHFLFEAGNIFTLNSNLSLTGVGRTNPIIRIAPGATIAVTNPFEWRVQDGAIVREPGSSNSKIVRSYIWLRNGSTFKAQNVLFDDQQTNPFGMPSGVFVSVQDPFDVSNDPNDVDYGFDNCIFQNTGIAVELNVPYAQSLPFDHRNINLEFRNSTFTNCQALRADRGYKTVFENCTLTKSNIDIAHTNWLNIRGTTMRYNPLAGSGRGVGTAIKARYVGHLWFRDGSLIDSWDTGIDDSEGGWNIITTASTIQSCGTGIILSGLLNSQTETGLLYMDCARLIQNDLGIKGQDVIFSTFARSGTANVFTKNIDNPGLFIESVFKDRQNTDNMLWLFGNYWDGTTPFTTSINNAWSFRVKTGSPQQALQYVPWVGTINLNPVLTDSNDPAVQNCGGVNPRGGNEDPFSKATIVNINGILYDVKVQQDAGMSSLRHNNLGTAQNLLNPVADIPNSIRDTASAVVKHFISESRALTLRGGVQLRSNSKSGWLPEAIVGIVQPENSFAVSPNPTNERFDITLPQGDYDIQVFDALGKRILVKNTEGGISSIDVRNWHNGIYMVSLLDKTNKKKTFSKVVVQH